jgi:hypothetical protein
MKFGSLEGSQNNNNLPDIEEGVVVENGTALARLYSLRDKLEKAKSFKDENEIEFLELKIRETLAEMK